MTFLSKWPESKWRLVAGAVLVVALALANSLQPEAQQRSRSATTLPTPPASGIGTDPLDFPLDTGRRVDPGEQRRLAALNLQRQKKLVAETNRLVKMAADLHAQINNQQHSQLTPEQMQQLAEIQKLAHSIRDKMSTPVAPLVDNSPFMLPPRMR